jgi:phospholipid/cholesterol/gamma-HCH transport system ATP-binding protein
MADLPVNAQTIEPLPEAAHARAAAAHAVATRTTSIALDQPVVQFEGVSIGFEGHQVLSDISFVAEPGETRVILGPAGVGKSVLLKLANGLLLPDSGEIRIFGRPLRGMTERELFELRARIGMVFQESALFDSLDVEDNVAYQLEEQNVDPHETHDRVVEALRFVELEKAIDKFPSELSGGMRRRVSIARAIINHPDLILYDSPTGGLDPITSNTIIELVAKQRDVSHTTSLLITHRLQDAFTLATHRYNPQDGTLTVIPDNGIDPNTKFLVLNEGKVVFDGETLELTHSEDPWLKAYLE